MNKLIYDTKRKIKVMKPKEKAKELLDKFEYCTYYAFADDYGYSNRKDAALIAVDEIFEFMKMDDEYTDTASNANSKWVQYWIEVKQEIENYEQ